MPTYEPNQESLHQHRVPGRITFYAGGQQSDLGCEELTENKVLNREYHLLY